MTDKRNGIRRFTVALVAGGVLVSACGGAAEVASPSTAPSSSAVATTTSTSTTTTTTLPPRVTTFDLPVVVDSAGERDSIRVMQRVLAAVCCPMDADGSWGPKTAEALEGLRGLLGLAPGGLDTELWEAVYRLPAPEEYAVVKSPLHPMPLPNTAVMLRASAESKSTEYTLAADTEIDELSRWLSETYVGKDFSSWAWCRKGTEDIPIWNWWRKSSDTSGRVMQVVVTDVGVGRVDLSVREVSAVITNCAGYSTPTTVARPAPSSGTSSGGSGGMSCTIGMNLERCEDLMGAGLGQRLVTRDCSGRDRSVFWASNWWIIDAIGGIPVVSKSRSGCS